MEQAARVREEPMEVDECEAMRARCRVLDRHTDMLLARVASIGEGKIDPPLAERIAWVAADRDRLMEIIAG